MLPSRLFTSISRSRLTFPIAIASSTLIYASTLGSSASSTRAMSSESFPKGMPESEWKAKLTKEQFRVRSVLALQRRPIGRDADDGGATAGLARQRVSIAGSDSPPVKRRRADRDHWTGRTEMAGTGEYDKHQPEKGVYECAGCSTPLYTADTKVRRRLRYTKSWRPNRETERSLRAAVAGPRSSTRSRAP